jgi:DNA-binding transcriptional MocR family regulator
MMAWKLRLKPNGGTPLYKQIESSIRDAIGSGRLKSGERIPSVADLAAELKINRITVHKVFQRLEKAGLLRSEVGRGTFVAANGDGPPQSASVGAGGGFNGEPVKPEVARSVRRLREGYAGGLRQLLAIERRPGTINLSGGVPSQENIPAGLVERLTRDVFRKNPARIYEYCGPAGMLELREALRERLARRGVSVTSDEIIITNGSQQAISLAAAWARDESRAALCETPTYTGVPGCMMLFGHAVQSVPWENGAPNLDTLRGLSAGRRVVFYLCPDFHNPTGQSLSTAARQELAGWARQTDALVIDDEIFREMRFEGEEPPSLYSLLPPGRRVMVGSISKTFMPGLRVGFLVADRPLAGELVPYKRYMDVGGPSLTQAIAAEFLRDGYDQHLETIRAIYRERRDVALAALKEQMPTGVTWTRPQGGFQLWVTLPRQVSSVQLFLDAVEHGVSINPGPVSDIDGRYLNCFRLGYGHATPGEIRVAIARLAEIVGKLAARGADDSSGLGINL